MSQTVTMGVNEDRLLDLLRNSFTNSTTFLGELLQNARRAGATRIDFTIEDYEDGSRLVVVDNGSGIRDWSGLVSICESGWDAETMADDKPFGIGFLSALCAAEFIDVVSNGDRMCCDTELLLSRQPTPVTAEPSSVAGTTIGLSGITVSSKHLESDLRSFVRGFPLPVTLNGEELERPDADDDERFVDSPVGRVALATRQVRPTYYLQGLPVTGPSRRALVADSDDYETAKAILKTTDAGLDYGHVVHLDSRRFKARLPDRAQLLDMRESAALIAPVIRALLGAYVRQMKSVLDAAAFASRFDIALLERVGCLDLLNDIPLLASEKCEWMTLDESAILRSNTDDARRYWPHRPMVTKEEIEAADLVISRAQYNALCDTLEEEHQDDEMVSPTIIYLAHFNTVVIETSEYEAGHWIHPMLSEFDNTSLSYRATGRVVTETLQSIHYRFRASICEAVEMDGPLGTVRFDDWALPQADGKPVLLPATVNDDAFQTFISFWDSENDTFDPDYFNAMTSELIAQVRAIYCDDMSRVVAATLGESSISSLDTIRNKRFSVSFDEHGQLTVENAA